MWLVVEKEYHNEKLQYVTWYGDDITGDAFDTIEKAYTFAASWAKYKQGLFKGDFKIQAGDNAVHYVSFVDPFDSKVTIRISVQKLSV